MVTLDQCIDLRGLNEEVEAIARHASVPEIIAAQMARHQIAQAREGLAKQHCIVHQRLADASEFSSECRTGPTLADPAPGKG